MQTVAETLLFIKQTEKLFPLLLKLLKRITGVSDETFGNDLLQSMEEALGHARGEDNGTILHKVDIEAIDGKAIRSKLRLTQEQMHKCVRVPQMGVGGGQPSGAALLPIGREILSIFINLRRPSLVSNIF